VAKPRVTPITERHYSVHRDAYRCELKKMHGAIKPRASST